MNPDDKVSPRGKCYHAIGHAMGSEIAQFLVEHPELLKDAEHLDKEIYRWTKLRDKMFLILDGFEIGLKEESERAQ